MTSTFDIAFLALYFSVLLVLSAYGTHRYYMAYLYYRHRDKHPKGLPRPAGVLPRVTVQLPIYNERYVIERLIDAVCEFDYPHDALEIQVLDDSTDDTHEIVARSV